MSGTRKTAIVTGASQGIGAGVVCGHVGCRDSSPGKHATKHFHEARPPVMRSVMPGATWTWCYVHVAEGRLGQDASTS